MLVIAVVIVGSQLYFSSPPSTSTDHVTVEMIEKHLRSMSERPTFLDSLEELAPDEYRRTIKNAANEVNSLNSYSTVLDGLAAAATRLRVQHAENALASSDANLKAVLRNHLAIITELSKDNEACIVFLKTGIPALPSRKQRELFPQTNQGASAMIRTLFSAEGVVVPRKAPNQNDWEKLLPLFLARGLTGADRELIATENYENPGYCLAMIKFLQAVIELQGKSGERIRAVLVYGLAKA